ncbi:hypothetical protein GIY23_06265 [Allosaccharopolyspora coralli]|uniref:Uncharacterized protein n=1 Tax=Allosaccharopolyspora coralli TaxID=2665642 RepID=A0A5Q3QCC9_9PSEU|nr:hypothetical protein [Allosaccharopolyspora coralli]QGK69189.1 hypothetical protein GIY23_06265 [Allosaccharopolyspora coralli]
MQQEVSPVPSATSARLVRPAVVVVAALAVVAAALIAVSVLVETPDGSGTRLPGEVVTAVAPN